MYFLNAINHLKTITKHKLAVMRLCFRVGLIRQGILHDLSKYSPVEFLSGARYYQGFRSPNAAEKEEKGYSEAWLHHKGRNRHHFEYWIDFAPGMSGTLVGNRMPLRYTIEMFLDRVAACKVYQGKNYTDESPLRYFHIKKGSAYIHPATRHELEMLLKMLAERGEEETLAFVRALLRRERYAGRRR